MRTRVNFIATGERILAGKKASQESMDKLATSFNKSDSPSLDFSSRALSIPKTRAPTREKDFEVYNPRYAYRSPQKTKADYDFRFNEWNALSKKEPN